MNLFRALCIAVSIVLMLGFVGAVFGYEDIIRVENNQVCNDLIEKFGGTKEELANILTGKLPPNVVETYDGYIIDFNDTLFLVNGDAIADCLGVSKDSGEK